MDVPNIDIKTLIATCQTVLAGGKALYKKCTGMTLSNEEKVLLKTAKQNNYFALLATDQDGWWVRVDGKDFSVEGNPTDTANYLTAFKSLCERGYIIHKIGREFCLSKSGYEKVSKLR